MVKNPRLLVVCIAVPLLVGADHLQRAEEAGDKWLDQDRKLQRIDLQPNQVVHAHRKGPHATGVAHFTKL